MFFFFQEKSRTHVNGRNANGGLQDPTNLLAITENIPVQNHSNVVFVKDLLRDPIIYPYTINGIYRKLPNETRTFSIYLYKNYLYVTNNIHTFPFFFFKFPLFQHLQLFTMLYYARTLDNFTPELQLFLSNSCPFC